MSKFYIFKSTFRNRLYNFSLLHNFRLVFIFLLHRLLNKNKQQLSNDKRHFIPFSQHSHETKLHAFAQLYCHFCLNGLNIQFCCCFYIFINTITIDADDKKGNKIRIKSKKKRKR